MIAYDRDHLNSIRLLTAYHQQCMGCHDKMNIEKGNSTQFADGDRCVACHEKKVDAPAEITDVKNENVVRQNSQLILNVWKPE